MGINLLWGHIGPGEKTGMAELASSHYQETGRPLRIAVDAAYWWYKNVTTSYQHEIREETGRKSNPRLKNILYRIFRMRHLGISLLFVFDSPNTPYLKGKLPFHELNEERELFKQMLNNLGIPHRMAPLEAEAECAQLEKLGLVDYVFSHDGDAFMFGCTRLIQFHLEPKTKREGEEGRKNSITHVDAYDLKEIERKTPGLNSNGILLYCVLAGADYGKGLEGFGDKYSFQATRYICPEDNKSLGDSLRQSLNNKTLPSWRRKLLRYLESINKNLPVPRNFPDEEEVKNYTKPRVTAESQLRRLYEAEEEWHLPIVEERLESFFFPNFNFDARDYTKWIIPILLIKQFLESPSEVNCEALQFEIKKPRKGNCVSKVLYEPSKITVLDLGKTFRGKDGKIAGKRITYDPTERESFDALNVLIQLIKPSHGLEAVSKNPMAKKRKADETTTTAQASCKTATSRQAKKQKQSEDSLEPRSNVAPRSKARVQATELIDLTSDTDSEKSSDPIPASRPGCPVPDRIVSTSGINEDTHADYDFDPDDFEDDSLLEQIL